jgi:5-methylthioadenosine/S-adenosylhomocysteine deaminase
VTENAVVAVTDGTITTLESGGRVPEAETVIDGADTVLVPGLVNAHAHLELGPLLGLFSDFEGLNLFAVAARLFFELDDEEWRQLSRAGGRLAALAMLSSGITTVNSMDRTPAAFADALGESGMRAVLGPMISDVFLPESRSVQFDRAASFIGTYDGAYGGRLRASIAPQGDLYCTPETWDRIADLANAHPEARLHTHALEHPLSETAGRVGGAADSIDVLASRGLLTDRTLIAHLVHGRRKDAERIADAGAHVLHCPSAITYFHEGDPTWPPMTRLAGQGANVALGLDDAYWIDSWDLLREAKQGLMMKRLLFGEDTSSPHEFFRALTRNGAIALGFDDVGLVREGKAADFALLDVSGPRFVPGGHWPARVVNTATAGDVRDVVVAGKPVVRNGVVRTLDEATVLTEAREAAETVLDRLQWEVTGGEVGSPNKDPAALALHAPAGRIGSWALRLGRQYLRDRLL